MQDQRKNTLYGLFGEIIDDDDTDTMQGEYYCNYLLKTGGVCGRSSPRPEGCFEHWITPHCKVCGKPSRPKLSPRMKLDSQIMCPKDQP